MPKQSFTHFGLKAEAVKITANTIIFQLIIIYLYYFLFNKIKLILKQVIKNKT